MAYDARQLDNEEAVVSPSIVRASFSRWDQAVPARARASLTDTGRICPVAAGVGFLKGSQLKLRLPKGTLNITAPRALLSRMLSECDGVRTWQEVVERQPASRRDEFDRFLQFLFDEGAFVDASNICRVAAGYAHASSVFGKPADTDVTREIARRHYCDTVQSRDRKAVCHPASSPLQGFFEERKSIRTFGGNDVAPEQLHALLFSAGGIVEHEYKREGVTTPRRTHGSGGALHLIRWIVVLSKAIGNYPPAVYEAVFPDKECVGLIEISRDISLFHRAFGRPWQQTFATGAIFAVAQADVASLRYRNRAVQYLFIEAGCAFQNIALAAPKLGLATSMIGGYNEDIVKELCRLQGDMVLCSAIFGPMPTAAQIEAQEQMVEIEFCWAEAGSDEFHLPFHLARATIKSGDSQAQGWGSSPDAWAAFTKSHAEAVERQGMFEPREWVLGKLSELEGAIDPLSLVAYSGAQYARDDFPFAPFDPTASEHWVKGVDLDSGGNIHVLASFVHRCDSLKSTPKGGRPYTGANSSGCAAGPSLDFALQAALLELIERDAFMRHWLTQSAGARVPAELLPPDVQNRVATLRALGCDVVFQKLSSAAAIVILASAQSLERHFTCMTAAARFHAATAAQAALSELECMVASRLDETALKRLEPDAVRFPVEHAALYGQKKYFRKADSILKTKEALLELPAGGEPHSLHGLVSSLIAGGYKPVYVDITPRKHHIDQGRTPLTVVKALVPGLVPISFGYGREPLAMVPVVDSGAYFPHPFP